MCAWQPRCCFNLFGMRAVSTHVEHAPTSLSVQGLRQLMCSKWAAGYYWHNRESEIRDAVGCGGWGRTSRSKGQDADRR